jgi:glyoxylate/hydroxypyruvate reductase A
MAKPGFIVNVGRGGHVVEDDLLDWLELDSLAGADVHIEEPLPASHKFWTHSRIRVPPHIGAFADPENVAMQVLENHQRVLAGAPPVNRIDFHQGC